MEQDCHNIRESMERLWEPIKESKEQEEAHRKLIYLNNNKIL